MKRIAKGAFYVFIAAVLVLSLLVLIGLVEAASQPIERRLGLGLSGWPRKVAPVQVALLSDIHFGNRAMTLGRLDRIVDQVNAAHPDLILIAGDFVVDHEVEGAAKHAACLTGPLGRLRAPLGTIAVLGNHDHWTAPDAIRTALTRAGITVLANRAQRRGPLLILGADDAFSGHDDLAKTLSGGKGKGGIPLLLTHSPDLLPKLREPIPLVMVGHTHCGQVVLPRIGPLITQAPKLGGKALYDPRYRCGIVRDGERVTVVTGGLGSGTSPIRLGAPPDWWLVRIGPSRPKA